MTLIEFLSSVIVFLAGIAAFAILYAATHLRQTHEELRGLRRSYQQELNREATNRCDDFLQRQDERFHELTAKAQANRDEDISGKSI